MKEEEKRRGKGEKKKGEREGRGVEGNKERREGERGEEKRKRKREGEERERLCKIYTAFLQAEVLSQSVLTARQP
jgi:hypothetical protein